MADPNFKVEKLTSETYHSWKFNMKMYLIGKDLWEIVCGNETLEDNTSPADQRKFQKRENLALASICLSISTSLQIYVRSAKTAQEAWENLEKHFQRKTLSKKIFYRRKLYSARMEKGSDMTKHINYVKTLAEHLEAIEDPVQEKDLVIILISSLPEEYNYLITALETIAEDNLTWDYVRDRLIHEAEKMCKEASTEATNSSEDAFISQRKEQSITNKEFRCHYCNRIGHIARNCYKKKADEEKKKNETTVGNFVAEKDEKSGDEVALKSCNKSYESHWWIDSGASQHMTHDKQSLQNYSEFDKPIEVKLADNNVLHSFGKGDVSLKISDGKEMVTVVLKNVLFVPKLKNKLFSLPSVIDKGATVEFKGQFCELTINNCKYNIGHKHGKLYKLNAATEKETERHDVALNIIDEEKSMELWHLRFGHLGYDNLNMLKDKSMVDGMDVTVNNGPDRKCEGCAMGKQHRNPFPKHSEANTTQILERIHSDVCGPMNVNSVGGSRYFVTFIDDYSRYTTVYMMKTKDEVFDKFKEFVTLAENLTGEKVKCLSLKKLRSDNGGEYTSKKFDDYCKDNGIKREFTIPYSPQQNGVAERMNRTILEAVRSMLYHANLPHMFWAEAVATAVYLKNRSPTSHLKEMTPLERWSNKKPNVDNLKVFGCKALVHVPEEKKEW